MKGCSGNETSAKAFTWMHKTKGMWVFCQWPWRQVKIEKNESRKRWRKMMKKTEKKKKRRHWVEQRVMSKDETMILRKRDIQITGQREVSMRKWEKRQEVYRIVGKRNRGQWSSTAAPVKNRWDSFFFVPPHAPPAASTWERWGRREGRGSGLLNTAAWKSCSILSPKIQLHHLLG